MRTNRGGQSGGISDRVIDEMWLRGAVCGQVGSVAAYLYTAGGGNELQSPPHAKSAPARGARGGGPQRQAWHHASVWGMSTNQGRDA